MKKTISFILICSLFINILSNNFATDLNIDIIKETLFDNSIFTSTEIEYDTTNIDKNNNDLFNQSEIVSEEYNENSDDFLSNLVIDENGDYYDIPEEIFDDNNEQTEYSNDINMSAINYTVSNLNNDIYTVEESNLSQNQNNQTDNYVQNEYEVSSDTISENVVKEENTNLDEKIDDELYISTYSSIQQKEDMVLFGEIGLDNFAPDSAILESISINTQPSKTKYKIDETFDPTGFSINAKYSDNNTQIIYWDNNTVKDFIFNIDLNKQLTESDTTITVNYKGISCESSDTINLEIIKPIMMSVKTQADKHIYFIGEHYEPKGLVFEIIYSDEITREEISYDGNEQDFTIDTSKPLEYASFNYGVTVWCNKYLSHDISFGSTDEVLVIELDSISVASKPSKNTYWVGESFDPTGLELALKSSLVSDKTVKYSVDNANMFSFSPKTNLTTSDTSIEVTYLNKTCSIPITIKELINVSLSHLPQKASYYEGEKFVPNGLELEVTISTYMTDSLYDLVDHIRYDVANKNDFSFIPDLTTSLNTNVTNITVNYKNKILTLPIEVKPKKTSPSGGGGGGGGGGVSHSSNNEESIIILAIINEIMNNQPVQSREIQTIKEIKEKINTEIGLNWHHDYTNGKWKMSYLVSSGEDVFATNGFYNLVRDNGISTYNSDFKDPMNSIYYFDNSGYMVTGFVTTADNNKFFFENQRTIDEGKMVFGWKFIENFWYYFDENGALVRDTYTKDGYQVDAEGRWTGVYDIDYEQKV